MPEGSYLYCDVSLPVPLDQPFTYALPETLRHRVQPGSRLVVPFGPRKLTGVILRCHDDPPAMATREALRLIDAEPVLDRRTAGAGTLDRRLLLRAAGRRAARHAAAGVGNSPGQSLVADRCRARRRAAVAARFVAGRPGGADSAHAGKAAALGGVPGQSAAAGR